MKEAVAIILAIGLILFGLITLIRRENIPAPILTSNAEIVEYGSIENAVGQKVVKIQYETLGSWIKQNPNAKIVSLVSVGDGVYGRITSFVIVYEEKG